MRVLLCLMGLLGANIAQAQLVVQITKGVDDSIPIAVVPFGGNLGLSPEVDLASVIDNDLARSGQFKTMARSRMLERPTSGAEMDYNDWRALNIDLVVVGRVTRANNDQYRISFQLFDSLRAEQLMAFSYLVRDVQMRSTAHRIADLIYEHVTGLKGVFGTRVAYINKVGSEYRLVVADADGARPQVLARAKEPLMSPTWSPTGKELAYVAFTNEGTAIYLQDLLSGRRRTLSAEDGVNGAPTFSPNGQKLAVTLSDSSGNLDIYVLDLLSGSRTRVTRHPGIDTEPTWLDSGRLLFTSDRSGNPQIYELLLTGRDKPKRLTFEGKYNSRAQVSPDRRSICLVHQTKKGFNIATMDLQDRSLLVLTDGRQDESPSYAPNGSMLLYATKRGTKGVLAAVSVDGRVAQSLNASEGDIREPAWSPYTE